MKRVFISIKDCCRFGVLMRVALFLYTETEKRKCRFNKKEDLSRTLSAKQKEHSQPQLQVQHKNNLRGGDVVEHQKQPVGLGVAPPVVARAHGFVDLIVDHSLPVEIGDHKLHTNKRTKRPDRKKRVQQEIRECVCVRVAVPSTLEASLTPFGVCGASARVLQE